MGKTKAKKTKKAAAVKAKRAAPRQVRLPGTADAHVRVLDNVCQSIAETREAINDLRGEEAGLEATALDLMRRHERVSYRHAGVELIRVPGEEKLRVRTARERTATAESESTEETPAASEDSAA